MTLDRTQFFADLNGDGIQTCEPLLAGRYLCEALGKRTSSILGLSLIYDTLDNRMRPSRGRVASVNVDFAGLGGSVKYARIRSNAAQYWPLGKGFIFSIQGEGGAIKSLENNKVPGTDDVRLTDRFYLGEPQMRGFDIRGVGPRVLRKYLADIDGDGQVDDVPTNRDQWTDDSIGGKYYYMGRAELEIPLGSGAREMGLRPSVFLDVGAVWGITRPQLSDAPDGFFIPQRDASGNALYTQITAAAPDSTGQCVATASQTVTNPINPNPPSCLANANNTALGSNIPPFIEEFVGNSPKPRVSIGVGVNWNSPFGPFRIDFAKTLLKQPGDDTKSFTFNVGTQF